MSTPSGRRPFGIGYFSDRDHQRFPALLVDGSGIDLRAAFGSELRTGDIFAGWDEWLPRLRKLAEDPSVPRVAVEEWRPLPPVDPPGQIFCAGANYGDHVREIVQSLAEAEPGGKDRSAEDRAAEAEETVGLRRAGRPFVFSLPPSALCGADDDIVLWGPGKSHDWELELAVVIGAGGRDIAAADAMDHVAGYTVCNDVSTRDVMNREDMPLTDFLLTKGRPTFLPTGPLVIPVEFVPDYRRLRIRLTVNGETMQDATVDDMIFGIEHLVAYVSSISELRPGDLLLTGSPAGNAGHHGGNWLSPGDEIVGEIVGIGRQRNVCVADPREAE